MKDQTPDRAEGGVHEPRVLLEDVLSGLQWPRLVRAGAVALSPQRGLLGTAAVILLAALGRGNLMWSGEGPSFAEGRAAFGTNLARASWQQPGEAIASAALLPRTLVEGFPVSTFVLGIPMLVVWAIFGGAISRSAALEISLRREAGWPAMLAHGLKYARSSGGAIAIPIVLIGLGYLLLAAGGVALLSLPVVDWIGAALLSVGLLVGVAACVLALVIGVGSPMLIPAVAAEGSDAFDAIQRVLAYVTQRPLTTVIYGLIAGLSAAIGIALVYGIVGASTTWTLAAVTEWLSAADAEGVTIAGDSVPQRIAQVVLSVPLVLASGYVFSAVHSAGTLWYLVCRRACDRQDVSELWDPEP